jgi:formate hydrogenlyase transcriptional activator
LQTQVADFDFLNFSLHDTQENSMHLHWWEGERLAEFLPKRLAAAKAPSGWVRDHQQELLFPDISQETMFPDVLGPLREHKILTYYVVPLTSGQNRLGALPRAASAGSRRTYEHAVWFGDCG